MNIDEQLIEMVLKNHTYFQYGALMHVKDMDFAKEFVSQIKQSILKAIMEEGEKLKTNKYKDLWNGDCCKWCGIEKGKEHLGACDFLIEANKNATINKFESVIKEVLQTKTNE